MPVTGAGASDDDASAAEDAALASALGVKNMKRNSKDLVEAAFDGDLDEVASARVDSSTSTSWSSDVHRRP